MSNAERNAFDNLIFLCFPHHRTVDRHAERYPVPVLREWKLTRQADGLGALRGLTNLTEERLQQMIQEAYAQRDEVVYDTLERLERQGDGAADVIRELLAELERLRSSGSGFPDPDTVVMLSEASDRLIHLQDSATVAALAADRLVGLGDISMSLSAAAEQLARLNLQDAATMLNEAAENLWRARGDF